MSEAQETTPVAPMENVGRGIFHERGTLRIVLWAVALLIAWNAYNLIHINMMNRVHWQKLTYDANGLSVLALRDKEHTGYKPPYRAIEVGHAWQIRRTDEGEDTQSSDTTDSSEPEAQDRGNAPAGAGRVSHGEVVPMHELITNCPTVLLGRHFTNASMEEKSDPFLNRRFFVVHLGLSPEGRSRYWQMSLVHDQERVAFFLQGQVITCPRINHMDTRSLTIDPVWDESDAKKLVDYINGQHP